MKWLDAFVELDHPVAGRRMYPNVPFKISDMTLMSSTTAPVLGQHTAEICRDMLGLAAHEVERLRKEEVLDIP